MAAVDTVVLPSLNEGMPLAILEGFACGKPLVGSTAGGIPELVTDRRFGFLVPPSSPDALASALENAMDRPWDAALLRSRAMEFRWDKVVEALHAVYEDVADGKKGERSGSSSSSAPARRGDGGTPHPTISIIIKALNEEATIGVCIESALRALAGLEGEVILADSLSSDRTIEVAGQYPIRIVQLLEPRDRCCGVGAQLGYQHARGEFIYILDADMVIDPAFMAEAMRVLDADRSLAGVAGLIEELGGGNYDFERRKLPTAWGQTPGPRRWLVCGGLYRREAIQSVGYLTNRNLHAEEEMELGLRLTQAGWQLVRLPMAGVRHYGDSEETLVRLKRRWGDRRADAGGELLRAAWRKPYFWAVVRHEKHLIVTLSGWCWFLVSVILLPRTMLPLVTFGLSLTALFGIMSWKKRSVRSATLGLIWWQVDAAGLLRGLMRRHRDPSATIESRTILHQKVHQ
jgi:glycosyltransferase involved in cell wall biosynthesis